MTNKTTKRALFTSVMALFLCFTMLLGTTFAWFTDSVTSTGNKIVAGNLDVQLHMYDGTEYVDISDSDKPIFGEAGLIDEQENVGILWEPGKTQIVYLAVKNAGNLALKYNVIVDVEDNGLVGALDYAIIDDATKDDADALAISSWKDIISVDGVQTGLMQAGRTIAAEKGALDANSYDYFALAVHMKEEAGNEYKEKAVVIDINIVATQLSSEDDSFDDQYDADANFITPVATLDDFFTALENGDDVLLTEQISINESFINYMNERYPAATFALGDETVVVDKDAVIDGGGITVYRTEEMADKPLIAIDSGYTLVLSNITLDGGAKWTGDIDPVLLRGTNNSGITTSGVIVHAAAGAHIILEDGAVLQNNEGAFAVNLTRDRNGSSLTLDGGEIINNHADGGAIWGGGKITVNAGKINGNSSKSIAGAIRMLNNNAGNTISFTMNGGEINHNKATTAGGAIWCGGNANYTFNGGEIAYNHAGGAGGAIEGQAGDNHYISGDFELHHNTSDDLGSAIHFSVGNTHTTFKMTGGKIYANGGENDCDIFAWNKYVILLGGEIDGNISYTGGLALTVGNADVNYVDFNTARGDYKIHLDTEIGTLRYVVNEEHSLFSSFMLQPADGYTYTDGDEAKLVCMNEGYETYWDVTTNTFRLKATN